MKLLQIIIIASISITWCTAMLIDHQIKDDNSIMTKQDGSGCLCENYSCGCCDNVNWLKAIGKLCTNISYLADDYGFSLTVTWNKYVLYNNTISAKNPPAFCADIPELEKIGEICLRFYDLSIATKHFHGCMEVKVILWHAVHKSIRIGCITIPNDKNILQQLHIIDDDNHQNSHNNSSNHDIPSVIIV
ncbi:hypothetical protein HCN44_011100 [Aphidius gifuensis]|uniref:DUF4773 domain-containing protein n=1 Tax=Aphidius gifuensis TaxID=684658 RepID=A0A834XXA6_APHGI|nr:uncharacterized protein LOC122851183 isoform X1 [Aphidius gifuensis]KAF7993831.1 hypothetical protein HCN44_011100 [Aphidius gifuensis]